MKKKALVNKTRTDMTDERYSEREKSNQVQPSTIRSMKQKEKVNYNFQPVLVADELYKAGERRK